MLWAVVLDLIDTAGTCRARAADIEVPVEAAIADEVGVFGVHPAVRWNLLYHVVTSAEVLRSDEGLIIGVL